MAAQVPLSRSGKSGLSVTCTPVGDAGNFDSRGSAGSRLTASNLTELESLQRQISRKDKPRSPLHGEALVEHHPHRKALPHARYLTARVYHI